MIELKGFKRVKGVLFPAMDVACNKVIFNMARDLAVALKHTERRGVVVQAGGNCGVWPVALAQEFETVYTFEPHPLNFVALTVNTAHLPNVVRTQAALGVEREMIKLALAPHELENCGAFYVEQGGVIPVLRIDDFHYPFCDLIYLDIEGFELNALHGAELTIHRCRPTIVIEDKGLSEKYGSAKGDAEKWLAERFGYIVAERIHKDVVLVPA